MAKDATSEVHLFELSSEIARLNRRCADLAEELVTRGERPRVLESELATLQRRHAEAAAHVAAAQERLHKTEQAVEAIQRELQERTAELEAAHGTIAEQRATAVIKSDEIASLRNALETTTSEVQAERRHARASEAVAADLRLRLTEMQEAMDRMSSERTVIERRLADLLQTSAETQRRLEEETSARESARTALSERDGIIEQMGSRLIDVEERLMEQANGKAALERELETLRAVHGEATAQLAQRTEEIAAVEHALADRVEALSSLREELSASRDERVHLGASLAAREAELKDAESRAIVVENERGKLCERLNDLEAAVAHAGANEQRLQAEVALAGNLESSLRKQLAAMQAQLDGAREEIEQQEMRLERQRIALREGRCADASAAERADGGDEIAIALAEAHARVDAPEAIPAERDRQDHSALADSQEEADQLARTLEHAPETSAPASLRLVGDASAKPSEDRVGPVAEDSSESCSLGVAVEGLISAVRGSSEGVVEVIDASQSPTGEALIAVNLLASKIDGVSRAIDAAQWAMNDPRAFVYCAEGDRGFTVGLADVFPHPFDAQACAVRLVKRRGGTRRLLVVSDCTDKLGELRETLNRMRCSTAIVCDGRQALHLLSIIEPDMILVDAALPRGEGIRTLNILRCDQRAADVPLGVMWGHAVNTADYREQARQVIHKLPLADQDLRQAWTSMRMKIGVASERAESARESKARV